MNMNVKLGGVPEKIMDGAILAGLARTKTSAIILGLMELDNKYRLLERMEDEEDAQEARRIMAEVRSGKQKLLSQKEFEKKARMKIR